MISSAPDDFLHFVIAGRLNRDTILPISGQSQVDVLGGNLAYAAVGMKLWGATAGLLARVGRDYPTAWLDQLAAHGFELSGVNVLSDCLDLRRFFAHEDINTTYTHDPVQHFADRGLGFPARLMGYQDRQPAHSSRAQTMGYSIQISDIPESYLEASAVHICPIDYLSHMILPSVFRQGHATTITLSPVAGYMDASFWEEIPSLLSEITAFIPSEKDMRSLFQGRMTNLWEMAEVLAGYGPELIVIRTESQGYYLWDRENKKRWVVPDYQVQVVDPTGVGDAFAGGFLVGYRQYYDPLEAALMGSIADSMVIEGSGVFYALDVMPGLINARKDALREFVQAI